MKKYFGTPQKEKRKNQMLVEQTKLEIKLNNIQNLVDERNKVIIDISMLESADLTRTTLQLDFPVKEHFDYQNISVGDYITVTVFIGTPIEKIITDHINLLTIKLNNIDLKLFSKTLTIYKNV